MRIYSYVIILNFARKAQKAPFWGIPASYFRSKKVLELFQGSEEKKTSPVVRDCLTVQVRQKTKTTMSVQKKHRKNTGIFTTKRLSVALTEGINQVQSPPPESVSDIVTNFEDLYTCSDLNTPPAPFQKGQVVRIVNPRHSRRTYKGRFGEVAAVVRGSTDDDWTVYILFPGKPLAVAFHPNELQMITADSLVGGTEA